MNTIQQSNATKTYNLSLAKILAKKFRINQVAIRDIQEWEEKIRNKISQGIPFSELRDWIFVVARICQNNRKSSKLATFDPNNEFASVMTAWGQSIENEIRIKLKPKPQPQLWPMQNTSMTTKLDESDLDEFSLCTLFLDQMNLDPNSKTQLSKLENEMELAVERGQSKDYVVQQFRNFCRSHAGAHGYYDPNNRFTSLVDIWYDAIRESIDEEMHDDSTSSELDQEFLLPRDLFKHF
jgi:hypothetical protein